MIIVKDSNSLVDQKRQGRPMIVLTNSAQAYFREALESALKSTNTNISQEAQVYVVHLLNDFSRSEKAFAGIDHGEKIVMVQLLERAMLASESEALSIFRHLGDSSLYLLGFFKESENRRIVSKGYYEAMGQEAYAQVSYLFRLNTAHAAALFQELSDQFIRLVKVMECISNYRSFNPDL